jgi:hypothetical protein
MSTPSTIYLVLDVLMEKALRGCIQTLDQYVLVPNKWVLDPAMMVWTGIGPTGIGRR